MKVLIVMGGFFPGEKYGGPPVSVDNFCSLLNKNNEFYIVTHDHDLGDNKKYDNINDDWNNRENCKVLYLSDKEYNKKTFESTIMDVHPDVIYLQGLFQSCILPCLQLAKKHKIRVLLAPRGELCKGAFAIKMYKKIPYVVFLRIFGLVKDVHFQATSSEEQMAIQRILGKNKTEIHMLDNIPSLPVRDYERTGKKSGSARFVFISRIHPKKNLLEAVSYFKTIEGNVIFDIYGSIEDENYWKKCEEEISKLPPNVKVNYKGVVSHELIHEVFSKYDAFIFPTLSENYGHVIIESLLVGTPVIISNQTPWSGVNAANAGRALPLESKELFIQSLKEIINEDDQQAIILSKNAKEYAVDSLKLEKLKAQYQGVMSLLKLLQQKMRGRPMSENISIAVVHPDMQHSLKLTKAIKDAGYDVKYFTTFYDKPGSLTHFLKKFLGKKYFEKVGYHYNKDIDDNSVIIYAEFICYILFLFRKYDKKGNCVLFIEKLRNRIFDRKVSRYLKSHPTTAVVTYDIVSGGLLEKLSTYPIKKIVDMSAAYLPFMGEIFSNEIKDYPDSSNELITYLSSRRYKYHVGNAVKELKYADYFIAASEFTKRSLITNGITDDRVFICRYGIDTKVFNNPKCEKYPANKKKLNCIYVGNVSVKKGFRYLVKALEIAGENITVNVAGKNILQENVGNVDDVIFFGHITKTELIDKYREADIIVFPSLADGFSFSVLEAMACGVVPICSRNTGACDLISHGNNGLIVDTADYLQIANILNDIKACKYDLHSMSQKAIQAANQITWEKYGENVKDMFHSIFVE